MKYYVFKPLENQKFYGIIESYDSETKERKYETTCRVDDFWPLYEGLKAKESAQADKPL